MAILNLSSLICDEIKKEAKKNGNTICDQATLWLKIGQIAEKHPEKTCDELVKRVKEVFFSKKMRSNYLTTK